jgi:hypothetical protein
LKSMFDLRLLPNLSAWIHLNLHRHTLVYSYSASRIHKLSLHILVEGTDGSGGPLHRAPLSRFRPPRQVVLARAVPGDGRTRGLRPTFTGARPSAKALLSNKAVRGKGSRVSTLYSTSFSHAPGAHHINVELPVSHTTNLKGRPVLGNCGPPPSVPSSAHAQMGRTSFRPNGTSPP